MVTGDRAELAGAGRIEAEAHHRLILLVGRLGVGQALAADLDPLADDDLSAAGALATRQQLGARRQVAGQRLLQRCIQIDQMEGQLRGLAEQALDALRVLLARHLDQDPIVTLALDGGLPGADLVDPPAHDLERLANGGILKIADRLLARADVDPAAVAGDDLDLLGQRIGIERLQELDRPRAVRRIGERQGRGVAAQAEAAVADPRWPQDAADIVDQRVDPLLDDRMQIDLEQQMRAALEIEPEVDLLVGQPVGQPLHLVAAEQIG